MTTALRARSDIDVREAAGYLALGVAIVGGLLAGREEAGLAGIWVLIGLATALPLAVVARVWTLPVWLVSLAAAVPLSIIVIALLGDGGWFGAARAARFAWAALLLLSIISWARTPSRRLGVIIGVLVLVADQFAVGWFAWWGGGNPDRLMIGSFSWHNQFAAYCLIGAAAALVVALLADRVVSLLGGVVFVLAAVGVLASGSRAAVIMLVAAALVAAVAGVRARGAVSLLRWGAAMLGAVLANFFFTSSVYFPAATSGAPAGGLAGRGSAEGSWVARLDHWRVALEMGADSWLLGSGLSTYGLRSDCFDRQYYTSSPHNEWLLAWAEGGVVMAVPLLALLVLAVALAVRSVRPLPDAGALLADPARWAALLAMILALGHAAFDFDWAFPLLIVIAALVSGVAAAPLVALPPAPRRPASIAAGAVLAAMLAAATIGFALDPVPGTSLRNGELRESSVDEVCER